jgi:glycosyltransferase involved in cell wall biosynthesis
MSQRALHILFAHNEYGRPSGEEHAVKEIAGLLEANGHSISWFLRSSAEIKSFRDHVQAFCSGIYSFTAEKMMETVLSKENPDLVQVQNLYPFLSPSILKACRDHGVPVVMRCPNYRLFCPSALHLSHGQFCERCLGGREYWCVLRNCERDLFKSVGYAVRNAVARISRSILDNVGVYIVLSDFQRQRFIANGIDPRQIEVLPNVVPTVNDSVPYVAGDWIIFVGRASPEKGIEDFISAARSLPHLPFAVAGATDRMPHLVADSPKNVKWLGFLGAKDLDDAYRRSRIVVMPSLCFEGFPNVVAHAMVLEKPVIASRLGGMGEIVEDGITGLLFKTGDPEDLVSKITSLYSNADLCRGMGQAGRIKARMQYSPDAVYTRLMDIYAKAQTMPMSGFVKQ